MILTCPACATQYRLKDGAIPPEGRQVRCAACKHKWYQQADEGGDAPAAPAAPVSSPSLAETPVQEQPVRAQPPQAEVPASDGGVAGGPPQPDPAAAPGAIGEIPEVAAQEAMIAETPEPAVDADAASDPGTRRELASEWHSLVDPIAFEDNFAAIPAMHDDDKPRGGKLKWLVALVVLVVAAAAAFYFFAPADLKARAGIAEKGESELEVLLTTSDRQRLASGNELVAISGRVINPTDRVQAVPPIHAELRDPATKQIVHEWTIPAPARSLAPGASAPFNSAEVDVPQGGESLSLRFAS